MSLKRSHSLSFPTPPPQSLPFLIQPIPPTPSNLSYTHYRSDAGIDSLACAVGGVDYESILLDASADYYVGVIDNRTGKVDVLPAPLHLIKRDLPLINPLKESNTDSFMLARAQLGETFGNKKTRAQLKERERSKIDVSGMKDERAFIVGSVGRITSALPSKSDIKAAADEDRPIPPHDLEAVQPSLAYPVEHLMSKQISVSLSSAVKSLRAMHAAGKEVSGSLPTASKFFGDRVQKLLALDSAEGRPKARHQQLTLALYLCYLRAFRDNARCSRKLLETKWGADTPKAVLDAIYEIFTETSRTNNKRVHTAVCEAKLLSWIIVMLLHVDDFTTDVTGLAIDMSMAIPKLSEHFKSVGCKVTPAPVPDGSSAKKSFTKRAVLHAPLKFPEVRRKRAAGR